MNFAGIHTEIDLIKYSVSKALYYTVKDKYAMQFSQTSFASNLRT